MIRESLCKAKRVDNNEWIEGFYYKTWNYVDGKKQDIHYIINYEFGVSHEIQPETKCYFTYKYDINGAPIWENDIVKPLSNSFILQVVWNEEERDYLFKNLKGGYDFMIGKISELSSFARDKEVEIIGNIYKREFKKAC